MIIHVAAESREALLQCWGQRTRTGGDKGCSAEALGTRKLRKCDLLTGQELCVLF
jgi:hypothetical protein